jgi:hypothetical protein
MGCPRKSQLKELELKRKLKEIDDEKLRKELEELLF